MACRPLLRSGSEKLLDEGDHLTFFDGARSILIEGSEYFSESLFRELTTIIRWKGSEGIFNELLSFFLIEGTRVVDIISGPDLIDNALDGLVFS